VPHKAEIWSQRSLLPSVPPQLRRRGKPNKEEKFQRMHEALAKILEQFERPHLRVKNFWIAALSDTSLSQ
jgi:hypothetical protein